MEPVFVSSTFVDLQDYRKAVCDALRQAGFVDLAMEHLGARDERPLNECLRIVKEDASYFVGIYAHRYGYIPSGKKISITEAEYHAATEAGLKRFVYLVDPKTPWIPEHIQGGAPAKSLASFKRILQERHTCSPFTSADNLASKVVADLGRESRSRNLKRVNGDGRKPAFTEDWTTQRLKRYEDTRFIELVHVIEPSDDPNQEYDILIYLFRHRPNEQSSPFGLDDVLKAEFFLGRFWKDRIFECVNSGRYIGIKVSAYGSFLCMCRVTFDDGSAVLIDRYIDFESNRLSLSIPENEC